MSSGGERLALFQFFHVVRQLKSENFSGGILAEEGKEAITVRFHEGKPMDASSDSLKYSLPAFLLGRKLIDRDQAVSLLTRSASTGKKPEALLMEAKVFNERQLRRLKGEQSRRLFQTLFEKDDFIWRRLEGGLQEAVNRPFRLDSHEALFMAVSRAKDTEAMALFFADRWDTPLRKTGELNQYMIPFRSVFSDDDVIEILLAGTASANNILSRASNHKTALRQCFALCYTDMITFADDAGEGFQNTSLFSTDGELEELAETGQTLMFMPKPDPEPPKATGGATPPVTAPSDDVLNKALQDAEQAVGDPGLVNTVRPEDHSEKEPAAMDFSGLMAQKRAEAQVTSRSSEDVPNPYEESSPGVVDLATVAQSLPPLPPRGLPQPDTDEAVEDLLAREYGEMLNKGFYEILRVKPLSQLSEIRGSHARLKHRYSDARYAGQVLSDRSKEILALIRAALSKARNILMDRTGRRIYDEKNAIQYPEQAEVFYSRLFDADDFFQQARLRIKMTHWVEAHNLLERAVEVNAHEPEYLALLAWSLFQGHRSGQISDGFAPSTARHLLDKALHLRERCEGALYHRARMEQVLGNNSEAAVYYARLLRVNPQHSTAKEALKEVTKAEAPGRTSEQRRTKRSLWDWFKSLFSG